MSRTQAILTGDDYLMRRSFGQFKYVTGAAASIVILSSDDQAFYELELEALPVTVMKDNYGRRLQGRDTIFVNYSYDNLNMINRHFLAQNRAYLDARVRGILCSTKRFRSESESKLISFFMLNEFLAQDEFTAYHDFLNAKWDELYDLAILSKISQYAHTFDVYKHYSDDSAFTMRPKASKKIQMALELLTKDQLTNLVVKLAPANIATNNIGLYFENNLKSLSGGAERQMSLREVSNQLFRAFSVALLAGGSHSNINLHTVFINITEVIEVVSGRITRDVTNCTRNQITPNDLGAIGTFLEDNGDKFSIGEMFFVIYSLANHKLFARTGDTVEVAAIYKKFLKRDNALEIFKMIGEIGQSYTKQFPTITQWNKALESGELDFIMSGELTVFLITASAIDGVQNHEAVSRREIFGFASV